MSVIDDDYFLMANLRPNTTGLPMVIWVSERGFASHSARIKVCQIHGSRISPGELAVVTVQPKRLIYGHLSNDDLVAVGKWIDLNRDTILDYWHGRIDTAELISRLRRLDES